VALANATTTVDASKTVGEIQSMLAKAGAKAFFVEYEGMEPSAVAFKIDVNGSSISFALPCNWEGVLRVLKQERSVPERLRTTAHARRVGWRIIKDWLRAQLAIIAAGAVSMEEVMLPWALTTDGNTVSKDLLTGRRNLLGLPAPTKQG
jgi:hypothetical protein